MAENLDPLLEKVNKLLKFKEEKIKKLEEIISIQDNLILMLQNLNLQEEKLKKFSFFRGFLGGITTIFLLYFIFKIILNQ